MNEGKGEKSRLQPIGRFLQRRMMWATGLTGNKIKNWQQCQQCANATIDEDGGEVDTLDC